MSNETFITIRGNVARDPESRTTENGTWVRFSVGVTSRMRNASGAFEDRPTQWFDVRVYGAQAEHVARSVRKGTPVLVRGELRLDVWQKNGEDFSRQIVRAETVALDLHYRSYGPSLPQPEAPPQYAQQTEQRSEAAADPMGLGQSLPGSWESSDSAPMGEYAVPVA